jgi:hypothetical protein
VKLAQSNGNMATIKVDCVVKRNSGSFLRHRQAMDVFFDEIRQFTRLFDSEKTSKAGIRNACSLLEQQLPGALEAVASLRERLASVKDECAGVLFDRARDERASWARRTLARGADSVTAYFDHLRSKCATRGYHTGMQSLWRNWKRVVDAIDYAKRLNKHFGKTIESYLRSKEFAVLCADIDSGVDVAVNELRGTPTQVAEVLRSWGYNRKGEPLGSDGAKNGSHEPLDADEFDNEDGFVVADDDAALAADEDDGSIDVGDDDDDTDSDSAAETSSEDSATESNGAVLFEANIAKNNAKLINQVKQNGIERNGRTLRKRKYRHIDMELAAPHLAALACLDEPTNKRSRHRTTTTDDDDEEEDDDGKDEQDLDDSEDSQEMEERIRRAMHSSRRES